MIKESDLPASSRTRTAITGLSGFIFYCFCSMVMAGPVAADLKFRISVDAQEQFTILASDSDPITANFTHNQNGVSPSGFWDYDINFSEIEKPSFLDPNDKLVVTGTVQHVKSPTGHGDGAGTPIAFRITLDADKANNNSVKKAIPKPPKAHGSHKDVLVVTALAATEHHTFVQDEILSYEVNIDVKHLGPTPSVQHSFETTTPGKLSVSAGYEDATSTSVLPQTPVTPGGTQKGLLPQNGELFPTDFTSTFEGRHTTQTTMAFVAGDDLGLSKLELGTGMQLFPDIARVLMPVLASDGQDLFVSIDLFEWMNALPLVDIFDMFDFTDGRNDALPGILVSNTPIVFSALNGFETDNPYSGTAQVINFMDLELLPEPSGWSLLVVGLIGLYGCRRPLRAATSG
ncbi:hypothetical protein [Plasticicumulans acidivorans]|uniref:Uncharacterized protein n=1 Tax=Plasticicumulans acidivorans TaxID=886464 RepID=A0A317MYM1_9GAMM|nr:hypothetical protein [Plasticicumulans acidivorans]PWV64438.1 hypothetical protein C7443_10287 [Plasticicumulans acidivorans]